MSAPLQWFEWTTTDSRYRFGAHQSRANADFLLKQFSNELGLPLSRPWEQANAQSNLYLNWLAEDLRALAGKPGLAALLPELRKAESFEAARHALHVAALYERGRKGSVVSISGDRTESSADFVVAVGSHQASVAAKLLADSAIEQQFQGIAALLGQTIERALFGRSQSYDIFVVIADLLKVPRADDMETQLRQLPTTDCDLDYGAEGHHVWASVRQSYPNFRQHRSIQIYAPVHAQDTLRIQGSVSQGARQILPLREMPGAEILALALAPLHDPSLVFSILRNQMQNGHFGNVGATLLIKTGTTPDATGVIDLTEVRANQAGSHPELAQAPLGFEDQHRKLTEAEAPNLPQPVYRAAYAKGRRIDTTNATELAGPDVRRNDPAMEARIRRACNWPI